MPHQSSDFAYSKEVIDMLRAAEWYPGRNVPWKGPLGLPKAFDKARRILEEFGGLKVGKNGPGVDHARSDIEFNAELGAHLSSVLAEYESQIGATLYPLGVVHAGHLYLSVDDQGRVYLLNDIFLPVSLSISGAIEKILLGKKYGFEED